MKALFLAIVAEGCAMVSDLPALLEARVFLFYIFYVSDYFFDEGHKALITCSERGVVQHQLLEHGFFIHCGGDKVIEVPFKSLDADTFLLYLIIKRGIGFALTGGRI